MISFVTTPTHAWLEPRIIKCTERFLVACPYVGDYLARAAKRLSKHVSRVLVTKTDLRDFATGASDIEAVCETARLGTKVLSFPRLHAKVYILDNFAALVTSANATHSGMHRNWECGIAIAEEEEVIRLADLVLSGFGAAEPPEPWALSELEKLREPVRVLREAMPPLLPSARTEREDHPEIALSYDRLLRLGAGLPGWTQLTLQGVMLQSGEKFSLHDIYRTCLPMIAKRYPGNKFPREKLRQQMQRLRDLGMVEFLGGARYRRTVKPQN